VIGRRWAAVLCTLALAAGCGGGSGDGGDPLAEAPASTAGDAGTDAPAGGYQPFTVLGTITDPAIGESSGLAASRRNPGLLWTHNDSGDEPLVYCIDLKGAPCGVWRVTGAEAWDWEDMAAGPGPRPGEPYLYLGDIGDNVDGRSEIFVYRIPEPAATASGATAPTKAAPAASAPAEALTLRFPDGPHNAEALAVHPTTGDLYVITKDAQAARVYKAAAPLDASKATTMIQVGTIRLGAGSRGLEQVTGADISPDGRRAALSTYAQGYELEAPAGGSFDDVWSQPPARVALGPRLQGEAIAYRLDGRALLTTSEIVPAPLQQVERRGT
jgi:hypothetical protein